MGLISPKLIAKVKRIPGWRWLIGALHFVIITLLTLILEEGTKFAAATFSHWEEQDKRINKMSDKLDKHLDGDGDTQKQVQAQLRQNTSNIAIQEGEITNLALQTNANTSAINSLVKTFDMKEKGKVP